jgi:molybdopterin synthase catalytic subunit
LRVKVLFFGVLREITGRAEDELELAHDARLADVFEHYAAAHPKLREMERSILLARNQRFAAPSEPVAAGDEIALLPPVSGGSGGPLEEIREEAARHDFAVTRAPIDVRQLVSRLLVGEDGAVVIFEGVARNNTRGRRTLFLEYECYEPMAVKVLAEIGAEIARAHPISRIGMVHRLGRLEIGETAVAVAVTAPHRGPAFEAAREGIDRLKRLAPIWKKEHFADGTVWAEGQWDESVLPE